MTTYIRSKGASLDIDAISRDLKQSKLKSDRLLKDENCYSDFLAFSGVPNPAPLTEKINIYKIKTRLVSVLL